MRSNLYSEQRFTNWSPHDPWWSEAKSIPTKMRPRAEVEFPSGASVPVFHRKLRDGFLRPWSFEDVLEVLRAVPHEHLYELQSVYLMGGTASQEKSRKVIFGEYSWLHIYLFPLPASKLTQRWKSMPKPNVVHEYTRFGALVTPLPNGAANLQFDESSLRLFTLYNTILHEIGHHVDRLGRSDNAERYADWYAQYQREHLQDAQSD